MTWRDGVAYFFGGVFFGETSGQPGGDSVAPRVRRDGHRDTARADRRQKRLRARRGEDPVELAARLLEGLQEGVGGFDTEQLGPRNDRDAAGGLVGFSGAEGQGLPDAVDADLNPLRLEEQEVGVQSRRRSPAAIAPALGVAAGTEKRGRETTSLAIEPLLRGAGQQKGSGKGFRATGQSLEPRRRDQREKRSERIRQVSAETRSRGASEEMTRTRPGSRRAISR